MKKLLLLAILTITYSVVYGQKSIDMLFEKYAGREGFTTVTINGSLLDLVRCFDKDDEDSESRINAKVSEIRILSQEDENMDVENFYDLVIKEIDLDKYDEVMRVKESDQDLRMLVRTEGKRLKEFLLIAGGEENALIQIRGDLTLDDAKKLSEEVRKNNDCDIVADQR